MTFSTMTLSITTCSTITLSIMTKSIPRLIKYAVIMTILVIMTLRTKGTNKMILGILTVRYTQHNSTIYKRLNFDT
jgi:hypothetical protein